MVFLNSWRFRLSVLVIVGAVVAMGSVSTSVGFPNRSADSDSIVSSLLLAASRDRLAVCVDVSEAASVGGALSRVAAEDAIAQVSTDRNWSAAGLSERAPSVEVGCPGTPRLLDPSVSYAGKPVGDLAVQQVERASPFRVFLFVVPQSQIEEIFGDSVNRTDPQEFLCSDGQCVEVSTALYVGDEEIGDASVTMRLLRNAIGLGQPEGLGSSGPQIR